MPNPDQLHPTKDFTLNVWGESDDWNNVIGHQMAGNHYLGGFSINYNNGIFTPQVASFWDENSSWIAAINQDGQLIGQRIFKDETNLDCVLTDTNQTRYLLDNENDVIKVLDTDLTLLEEIPVSGQTDIVCMALGPDNQIYALDTCYTLAIYERGCSATAISSTCLGYSSCWNKFEIDNLNQFSVAQSDFAIYSNCKQDLFWIFGNNLYKNGEIFFHLTATRSSFTIDSNDNIYVYYDDNRLLKIDSNGDFIYDVQIHDLDKTFEGVEKSSISITRELSPNSFSEFLWISLEERNYLLKVEAETGILRKCIYVPELVDLERYSDIVDIKNFKLKAKGDITGYNAARKRSCVIGKKTIQAKIMLLCNDCTPVPVELNYPTENLLRGKHMFTLCFDSENGIVKFYVDGKLVDSAEGFENCCVYYQYQAPFLVGGDSGKYKSLQEEIGTTDPIYYQEVLRDIKLWQICLPPSVIESEARSCFEIDSPFMYGELKKPISFFETVDRIVVNERPFRTNNFIIHSEFLESIPPNCKQSIVDQFQKETSQFLGPSTELIF